MIEVIRNAPLAPLTFYGVGGPADELYAIKNPEALEEIWAETIALNLPKIILGKGSNLLMSDKGFRGRVFLPKFQKGTWVQRNIVTVEAGKSWQSFVEETNKHGWEDLCKLSGIPGNVGGFIRGNAGAFGVETGDKVLQVEYLDALGILRKRMQPDCGFAYRESRFKQNPDELVVRATFRLDQPAGPEMALNATKELMAERWAKYPPGRSGGSFFKNPVPGEVFAGKLLEEAGAKGDTIGHAQVSERHANFILNLEGKATQNDILTLARKWRDKVKADTGHTLEPEIFICDEYGKKINL